MGGGNPDRSGLIAADCHVDFTRCNQSRAAGRGAAGRIARLGRIFHGTADGGVAAARIGQKFADRLARDFSAGIKDAADDGRIEGRHMSEKVGPVRHWQSGDRDRVLDGDALAGELADNGAPDG